MDGTPLTGLAGYRILYGQQSRRYSYEIHLENPRLIRYVVEGLGPGTWYFAIVAVDQNVLESARSAEAWKKI